MEYNRLVAYIYSYNNGLKNINSGFARVEIRNDNIKFRINITSTEADAYSIWGIYLFFRKKKAVCGIKLGEMSIRSGKGEFAYIGNAVDIEKTNISFEQIKGIFLVSGKNRELLYASEWDDEGFDTDAILLENEWNRNDDVAVSTLVQDEIQQEMAQAESDCLQYESAVVEIEENKVVQLKVSELEIEDENTYTDNLFAEYDEFEELPDQFDKMWELLSQNRDKMFLFADDELYDVVEITPEDIDKMPNTNWHLKNNSFVNHGFYNFRHLIAGKLYNEGNNGYFIGVPGIYNRRERSIAAMYGFNRFKFSMRSDMRLNQFGYWYREITD